MIRIGVDFGGTKVEAAALDESGVVHARRRAPNPGGYDGAIALIADLVAGLEAQVQATGSVGVGAPGSISPRTGLMRNANSVWLNGRPFREDLEGALDRPVRMANDANCMALSEAVDGAGAGARTVFGVIIGTGCGGGLAVDGRLLEGANGIAGEWGHTPLPWMRDDEFPGTACWCGRLGCLETWISGPGLSADHLRRTGQSHGGRGLSAEAIVAAARQGDPAASETLQRYTDRLGRALAMVCDIVDPDVIVLAGGMFNVGELYQALPAVVARHAFTDVFHTPIAPALHGDSSGVRGAAWLWPAVSASPT